MSEIATKPCPFCPFLAEPDEQQPCGTRPDGKPIMIRGIACCGYCAFYAHFAGSEQQLVEDLNGRNVANGLDMLANLFDVADSAFLESHASISMAPGEYADGSGVAPADITEIEIDIFRLCSEWIAVTTPEHSGWIAYLTPDYTKGKFREAYGATTLNGYCHPECDCFYCSGIQVAS